MVVATLDEHTNPCCGAVAAVEHAHLVIEELRVTDLRVARRERLAQRGVERVHRSVALRDGVDDDVADVHLDGRLAHEGTTFALLDERDVVDERERRRVAASAMHQQLERRLGALE